MQPTSTAGLQGRPNFAVVGWGKSGPIKVIVVAYVRVVAPNRIPKSNGSFVFRDMRSFLLRPSQKDNRFDRVRAIGAGRFLQYYQFPGFGDAISARSGLRLNEKPRRRYSEERARWR